MNKKSEEVPDQGGVLKSENDVTRTDGRMSDFAQFQLKEYDNISQAHFKTNEVLATFYRYYFLITAIPITTLGLGLMRLSENEIGDEARIIAYYLFGISAIILSIVGVAVIAYIEGLRLKAILYARVVNSIRNYFFNNPEADQFGIAALPLDRHKPSYGKFGSGFLMYLACSVTNATFFSSGILAVSIDKTVSLVNLEVSSCQWFVVFVAFIALILVQFSMRWKLIEDKKRFSR